LLTTLNAANLAQAATIARIPEEIRGYGHVKQRHLDAARPKWAALMAAWRQPEPAGQAQAA
jgi:indolepyruvate ferredoxin oxidoreductase